MSILGRMIGGDSDRAMTQSPFFVPPNSQAAPMTSASGMAVTADTAMQLSVVWACVRIISETIAGLNLIAVDRPDKNGLRKPLKKQPPIVLDPFGGNVFTGFNNSVLTRREGIAQTIIGMMLQGNMFYEIVDRDRMGRPMQLHLISPDRVDIASDAYGLIQAVYIDGREVNQRNLVHVPGLRLPGEVLGASVVQYARRTIGLGIAAEEYGSRFFSNGASIGGLIEVEGDLTNEEARQLKARFESDHAGVFNAHRPGILTGGAKYSPIGIPPEDAQFLGTRSAQTLDIAMMFGVPPHMLGQVDRTTSWGRGIEEQTLGFLKFTLRGWTDRIEDIWNTFLPEGQEVKFDYDELLSPDSSVRYTAYQVARTAGLMNINEIRAKEGLEPVDGGDDIMAPLNSAHGNDPGYTLGDPTQPMTMVDQTIPASVAKNPQKPTQPSTSLGKTATKAPKGKTP